MSILFGICLIVIIYTYFGYPLLLWLWSLVGARSVRKSDIVPSVSVLIPAHNEEEVIESKVRNLLELDYPREKLEILIGCDGCTDRTVEIVERLTREGAIRSLISREWLGKPSALNALAREANGEIFVLADARQRFDRTAIRELVRCLNDPEVASVSGRLFIETSGEGCARGVGLYWRYETWLREKESATGSMLGATGAIYAIRRQFFGDFPENILLDDVYAPMKAIMAGKRAVFEPAARAFDTASETAGQEYKRKVRTLAGNIQIFSLYGSAFDPFRSPIAWRMFSHKFLRLVMPYFLILLLASSIHLAGRGLPYLVALLMQAAFYLFALVGYFSEKRGCKLKGLHRFTCVPYAFCVLNAATIAAALTFASGNIDVKWRT